MFKRYLHAQFAGQVRKRDGFALFIDHGGALPEVIEEVIVLVEVELRRGVFPVDDKAVAFAQLTNGPEQVAQSTAIRLICWFDHRTALVEELRIGANAVETKLHRQFFGLLWQGHRLHPLRPPKLLKQRLIHGYWGW